MFLVYNQYWSGGFIVLWLLCPGTPEGSTGSGSGFKPSQKTGQRIKVSSDRLGEAGNRTCDPWFTRHRFIPYTTAAFSYTLLLTSSWLVLVCMIGCKQYEGGSICNETPFITSSTNALGFYAICQTKDQSVAVIMVHETLFYLCKFNKLQTF